MALSCMRTRVCKILLLIVLIVMAVVTMLLWRRAIHDGAVQIIVPVHRDPAGGRLSISILPEAPVVSTGHTAQLVCIVTGASQTYFEPPPSLSPSLLSSVHTSIYPGGAVLVIKSVKRGHAGVYTCRTQGDMAEQLQLAIQLKVEGNTPDGDIDSELPLSSPSLPPSSPTTSLSTSPPITTVTSAHDTSPSQTTNNSSRSGNDRGFSLSPHSTGSTTLQAAHTQSSSATSSGPEAVSETDNLQLSEVGSREKRMVDGEFQKAAVEKFCAKHRLPHFNHSLPSPRIALSHSVAFNKHMLTDDQHKVLFCFLPKVGCTNLKLVFYVNQGLVPRIELSKPRDEVEQTWLEIAIQENSFQSLNSTEKKRDLATYFKIVMMRNPLERLASAFRSKIERYALSGTKNHQPHYNWARKEIYWQAHPLKYRNWIRTGGSNPVNITFSDFIDYWLHPRLVDFKYDDHFMSMLHICQPCVTKFDFYGNFRHFDRDAEVLIQMVGASSSDLRQGYYTEDTSTEEHMRLYYSSLSRFQKRAVLQKMALELEFHYTIFPEERDSHKQILQIDDDLDSV